MEPLRLMFQGDRLWVGEVPAAAEEGFTLPEGTVAYRVAADRPPPPGVRALTLREAFGVLAPEQWARAGRAFQWLEWEAAHRFCGACAGRLEPCENSGRCCPACGRKVFPAASTAVIVLIRRGRELALARSPHFKPGVYSPVAGFTEPGESLEDAVHREVKEELGLRVANLRYFKSQPWPFPNTLMVGFHADYRDGELRPDPAELEDARWFTPENLPALPSAISVSRWLIDDALNPIQQT